MGYLVVLYVVVQYKEQLNMLVLLIFHPEFLNMIKLVSNHHIMR